MTPGFLFTGRDISVWLQDKLKIETEAEALNLSNMLVRLGYFVPVTERALLIKPDACFRIQVPAYISPISRILIVSADSSVLFNIRIKF